MTPPPRSPSLSAQAAHAHPQIKCPIFRRDFTDLSRLHQVPLSYTSILSDKFSYSSYYILVKLFYFEVVVDPHAVIKNNIVKSTILFSKVPPKCNLWQSHSAVSQQVYWYLYTLPIFFPQFTLCLCVFSSMQLYYLCRSTYLPPRLRHWMVHQYKDPRHCPFIITSFSSHLTLSHP